MPDKKAGKTVYILPESDDTCLCVGYADVIHKADYLAFHELMEKRLAETGKLRVFVYFEDNFQGWEPEAAEINFLSVTVIASRAEKVAYVNPDSNKVFQMKLSAPLMKGQVRFFDKNEYDEALAWAKS